MCFSLSLFNILFHLVQSIIECIEAASLTFKYTFLPFPWPLSLYLPLTFVSPFLSRSTGLCGSLFITFALINGTACSINLMSLKLSHQTSSLCGCFHVVLTFTFSVCHPHKSIHFPKMKTKWEKKRNYYLFGVYSPLSIISRLVILLTLFLFVFSIFVLKRQEWNKKNIFFFEVISETGNDQTNGKKTERAAEKKLYRRTF